MEQPLKHLPAATREKVEAYKSILKQDKPGDVPFWDIVVLSSGDKEQKKSYERQIDLKKNRKEIPNFIRYVVICDPPGAKIGNGGATMHVLEQLEKEVDREQLRNAKVMLVHAGGYSQRLPNLSVIGKVFMALPCREPLLHMLDALLLMYVDVPPKMNAGIFLIASDVVFLYNGSGDWDMKGPGVTAIAHPASLETATTHGVFVLEGVKEIAERYATNPDQPSSMEKSRFFLHKPSRQRMEDAEAVIPGMNQVYVDLGYYFDWPTADKLLKFYVEHKPLKCELDAYGDFLQALGPEASKQYCNNTANVTFVTEDLVNMRERVFELLQGTPLNVVVFNQAQFNHVGTTSEYFYHLFSNLTFVQSLELQTETMVREVCAASPDNGCESAEGVAKRPRLSFENCFLMHCVLQDRASVSIGEKSIVEYSVLEPEVSIGENCLVSNVHLEQGLCVPAESFLHTVPLSRDGKTVFATFAFDMEDSMKASVTREDAGELQYCGTKLIEALKNLYSQEISPQKLFSVNTTKCSLWTCQLFPAFSTRKESARHAVYMLQRLKNVQGSSQPVSWYEGQLSVADMLKMKSLPTVLQYHQELRENNVTSQ